MSLTNNHSVFLQKDLGTVNLKKKSTSATSELLSSISHTLSHEFDQQSLCCFTDIELPFKFCGGGDMIWSSVLAQLLHEVWASVMETQVFDAGSEPPLVSVCVCVFEFQEVALFSRAIYS